MAGYVWVFTWGRPQEERGKGGRGGMGESLGRRGSGRQKGGRKG